jgi:aldehyde:ferredoxin oxidoreductase
MLGANCLVDHLEALCLANELCNRYGIDTIETGSLVAFAMEAYEKGLITSSDTGGVPLDWGSFEAMLETVRMIGEGTHVGGLLNQGLTHAARSIGGEAEELTMQVKGLAVPAHDPRAFLRHLQSWRAPYLGTNPSVRASFESSRNRT